MARDLKLRLGWSCERGSAQPLQTSGPVSTIFMLPFGSKMAPFPEPGLGA